MSAVEQLNMDWSNYSAMLGINAQAAALAAQTFTHPLPSPSTTFTSTLGSIHESKPATPTLNSHLTIADVLKLGSIGSPSVVGGNTLSSSQDGQVFVLPNRSTYNGTQSPPQSHCHTSPTPPPQPPVPVEPDNSQIATVASRQEEVGNPPATPLSPISNQQGVLLLRCHIIMLVHGGLIRYFAVLFIDCIVWLHPKG